MELVKERNSLIGVLALLGVIIFAFCWFAAAVSDPDWVFGANYLSDLGVSDYAPAYKFFNGGCLLAGIMLAVCGTVLVVSRKKKLDVLTGIFTIVAGTAMSLIGIVTEDAGAPHYYIALVAFGIGFLSLIFLAVRDWTNGLKILALLTPVGVIAALVSFFVYNLNISHLTPELETVAIIVLLLLFLMQGMKFIHHGAVEKGVPGAAGRHRLLFGFSALIASVAFLLLWLFAALADPLWTFGSDPVYMLGASAVEETKTMIALACIVGGSFATVYGIGAGLMSNGVRSYGSSFIVIGGALVAAVGVTFLAAKDVPACAEQFALAFGMIALTFIVASDWAKKRVMPAAAYIIVLVGGIASLLIGYDAASAFCVLALFAVLGIEGVRLMLGE
jgi:hypothetical membrane protein